MTINAPYDAQNDVVFESVPCPCGAPNAQDRLIAAHDPVSGDAWTYRRCAACGMERLSPRPVMAEMHRYYADDYAPYSDAAASATSRVDRLKRLVYETYFAARAERSATARRFRPLLLVGLAPFRQHSVLSFRPPAARRVFELGAGSGADLLEFKAAGWDVLGCEPSRSGCEAAARHGVTLTQCTAEDAVLPDGLSCVYMNNVFEHLHEPLTVLDKARTSLVPDGIVVIIVPNHASWAARLFGAAWPGYDPPRHIWGYTPRALRNLFQGAGFEVVSIDHKYPLSTFCWAMGLAGDRAGTVRLRAARIRLKNLLGRGILLAGMVASLFGHGDYIRLVARKP